MALWPRSTITHWNNILKTHYIHWNPPDCSCVALWKRCGSILCVWVQNQTCTSHWKTKTSASFTQSLWLVIFPRSAHTHTHTHRSQGSVANYSPLPLTNLVFMQTFCRFSGWQWWDFVDMPQQQWGDEWKQEEKQPWDNTRKKKKRNERWGEERRGALWQVYSWEKKKKKMKQWRQTK